MIIKGMIFNTKMHILLLGTSSVGKTTIGRCFKDIGYTFISCDDFRYTISPKREMRFYSEDEEPIRDNDEQMFDQALRLNHKYVIYDSVKTVICKWYDPDSLFVVLLYASINRLITNLYNRRNHELRGWESVFGLFTQYYTYAN